MSFMSAWKPGRIEYVKEQVAEHFSRESKPLPIEFEKFLSVTVYDDIDMLKDAVVSITEELPHIKNVLVKDVCFTIEQEYQQHYKLSYYDFDKVA